MTDNEHYTDDTENLNNPMRFSLGDRNIDFERFPVRVTELEVRSSEGSLYVHWRPLQPDTEKEVINDE